MLRAHREGRRVRPDDVQKVQTRLLLVLPGLTRRKFLSIQSYFLLPSAAVNTRPACQQKSTFIDITMTFLWPKSKFSENLPTFVALILL